MAGLEVDGIAPVAPYFENIVVAKVVVFVKKQAG